MTDASPDSDALRRTMRDLVALSALASAWRRLGPPELVESLADALARALDVELVYVGLHADAEGATKEVARARGQRSDARQVEAIGRALASLIEPGVRATATVPSPFGVGSLHCVCAPVLWRGGRCVVVAGSSDPGFPSAGDRTLLAFGADNAAAALDRHAALGELRESEQRWRRLTDELPALVWTSAGGAYEYVSSHWCELTGAPERELLGFGWTEHVHPDDRARALAGWADATRDGGPYQVDYRLRTADGQYRWFRAHAVPVLDGAGHVMTWFGACADITTLQRTREAAESANRDKDEFLANVSHEIRTPMNAILGMTDLALGSPLTDQQRGWLRSVKAAGEHLLVIVESLLDFSKASADKLELDPAEFSLRGELTSMLGVLAVGAERRGIELVADVGDAVPDHLVGDAGRLRQVLINLIENAIKFTPSGGVLLSVEAGPVDPARDELELRFAVRDTGIGIPEHQHTLIFEAFAQADMSTTRRYGGTGLGLTIAAKLAALMHGGITVKSEPGQGSTFTLTARFLRGRAEGHGDRFPATWPSVRALVVDGNAVSREVLERWLREWRIDPTPVADGLSTLRILLEGGRAGAPHELLLVDGKALGLATAPGPQLRSDVDAHVVRVRSLPPRPPREIAVRKPVVKAELFAAIGRVLDAGPDDVPYAPPPEAGAGETLETSLRVLVADGNEFNARLLRAVLERRGHRPHVVESGEDLLSEIERGTYDVILLDVHTPKLDGFEVVARIRARELATLGHLPVIALAARSREQDRARCLAAGMDDFLAKPVDAGALWAALRRIGERGWPVADGRR